MNLKSKTDFLDVDASTQPAPAPHVPEIIKNIKLEIPADVMDRIGKLVAKNKELGKSVFSQLPRAKNHWIAAAILEKLERDEKQE